DAACAAAFPGDLSEKLAVVVERLNAAPLAITVLGQDIDFNGSDLLIGLGAFLKDEQNTSLLPGLLAGLDAGQYDDIEYYANALSTPPDPLNPIGAWLSMRCTDSILAVTPEAMEASLQAIQPAFYEIYRQAHQAQVEQCQAWRARMPDESDRLPAVADTPVLIISGALDPYSSQEWLDSTLAHLPNGQGIMLPYHLHYVVQHPCASDLLSGFIDDPTATLDSSCMADIQPPVFKLQ
ncbi:MAG: alpha/beta hydrolase, partial [Anaerolineae bacterium]|nr:alpha/beta hydrolase [Anaerolineae bacterium]